jgi:hypothetical protein
LYVFTQGNQSLHGTKGPGPKNSLSLLENEWDTGVDFGLKLQNTSFTFLKRVSAFDPKSVTYLGLKKTKSEIKTKFVLGQKGSQEGPGQSQDSRSETPLEA